MENTEHRNDDIHGIIARIATIDGDVKVIKTEIKSLLDRIDNVDRIVKTIYELASDVRVLTEQVKVLGESLSSMTKGFEARIARLELKPAAAFENIKNLVLGAIATGAVGFIVGYMLSGVGG